MTGELARDQTEDGRFYVLFAGTDREERFRSVTAPLGRWDKDGLLPWAGLLAGRAAFDDLGALIAAITTPDCGRTYYPGCDLHGWDVSCPDCRCKKCEPCMVRWMRDRHVAEGNRRKDEGTRVHTIVDHWATTGVWLVPEEDIKPYIDSFREFVKEYGLRSEDYELLEARVINRLHGYAGTLDAAFHVFRDRSKAAFDLLDRITGDSPVRLDHALILADYKSREKPERAVFLDQPLQLAGYRYAETIILKDGTEIPMFAVDATAVIQIRPDKTTVELMLAEQPEFETFLALLEADEWALDRGKKAIGARTFKYGEPVKKLRERESRQRRALEKKAEEAAAMELMLTDAEVASGVRPPDRELKARLKASQAALSEQADRQAAAVEHVAIDDSTCSCGWKVDGFTAPESAREKLHEKHITPENATADTPEARGKRAAAAARRGAHPVLAEMAGANGKAVAVQHAESMIIGRAKTVRTVLDADREGDLDQIPF